MKSKFLCLTTAFISTAALADTTLMYNNDKGAEVSRIYLADGLAKMTTDADQDTALIYNAQLNNFTIINHQEKSYMVFGEKEIAALGDVSAMIDRMMEEQLAQLPAAQREQMRGMVKSMVQQQMPKQTALPEYAKSGQTNSYNGFDCAEVVKTVEGKNSGSFCVANYQDLGVSAAEFAGISEFMEVAEKLASQFGQDQSMNMASIGDVLPVYYDMGTDKGYLTEVNNATQPASTFQVPAGYQQQSLPKEMFK